MSTIDMQRDADVFTEGEPLNMRDYPRGATIGVRVYPVDDGHVIRSSNPMTRMEIISRTADGVIVRLLSIAGRRADDYALFVGSVADVHNLRLPDAVLPHRVVPECRLVVSHEGVLSPLMGVVRSARRT